MPPRVAQIEAELRLAARSQNFEDVQRLVMDFCEAVESHVRRLHSNDPSIPEIAAMVQEVLRWTTSVVRSGRENTFCELQRLPKVKGYFPARETSTLQLDV
ncbi:MAG: hypothetical protein C5B51_17790 [Terriglobia bacterium]|nr:MAG: hypothetical protein C5B51_17790 [Terriglobia bacterium]